MILQCTLSLYKCLERSLLQSYFYAFQALAAEEATSKDVLAAQAVNDGFLDPADMPEGSGPLPGEETVSTGHEVQIR